MSSNKKGNIPMSKSDSDLVTTSWHGRWDPVTRERPTTYTLGTRTNSPVFTSIDDARKAKRELQLDPYRNSPLPDVFKTSRGETPTMEEIMPELKKRNEGWGEQRTKHKKGGRNTKTKKLRKIKKSRRTKKSRKSKTSRRLKNNN